jgi:anti-sigma regulatory factor (Ser/Thr protein kinase)
MIDGIPVACFDKLSRRVGDASVLALPMLRLLAILSGWMWIVLTPRPPGWDLLAATMLAFFLYSVALLVGLWITPGRLLRLNSWVVVIDLLVDKQIAGEGITIVRRLASGLPAVWGDANALQQVMMNLVTNAREALGGRGEILIETEPRADGVRLTVRDSGPGIPRETRAKIFDPFFTTKPNGTGLGLSISYGIVRDHRGTIEVESQPGHGTAFVLTFPSAPVPGGTA